MVAVLGKRRRARPAAPARARAPRPRDSGSAGRRRCSRTRASPPRPAIRAGARSRRRAPPGGRGRRAAARSDSPRRTRPSRARRGARRRGRSARARRGSRATTAWRAAGVTKMLMKPAPAISVLCDQVRRRQRGDQRLRELARIALQRLRELQRDVRRDSRRAAACFGRSSVDRRAGALGRDGGEACGEPAFELARRSVMRTRATMAMRRTANQRRGTRGSIRGVIAPPSARSDGL